MSLLSFLEYKNFIDAFTSANQQATNSYVVEDGILPFHSKNPYMHYAYSASKNPAFKIKQIAEVSQKFLGYFASETCSEALSSRICYLHELHHALQTCATRIESSIKKRWWYYILHFFGYQAKCPQNIQKLIKDVDAAHGSLQSKLQIQVKQIQEAAQKQAEIVLDKKIEEELIEPENHQKQEEKPLQEEKSLGDKLEVAESQANFSSMPALEAVTEEIETPIEPFDFIKLPENVRQIIYAQLSLRDLIKDATSF